MTVQPLTSHVTVVEFLAGLAREHPAARELWWQSQGDELSLWLFAEPQDFDAESALHALQLVLADRYPDLLFDLDIVNLKYLHGRRTTAIVPESAERTRIVGQ